MLFNSAVDIDNQIGPNTIKYFQTSKENVYIVILFMFGKQTRINNSRGEYFENRLVQQLEVDKKYF